MRKLAEKEIHCLLYTFVVHILLSSPTPLYLPWTILKDVFIYKRISNWKMSKVKLIIKYLHFPSFFCCYNFPIFSFSLIFMRNCCCIDPKSNGYWEWDGIGAGIFIDLFVVRFLSFPFKFMKFYFLSGPEGSESTRATRPMYPSPLAVFKHMMNCCWGLGRNGSIAYMQEATNE